VPDQSLLRDHQRVHLRETNGPSKNGTIMSTTEAKRTDNGGTEELDVLIVGAGFAGVSHRTDGQELELSPQSIICTASEGRSPPCRGVDAFALRVWPSGIR
jgi:hypothetical protein